MTDFSINMPVPPPLLAPAHPRSLISIVRDSATDEGNRDESCYTIYSGPADAPGPELYKLVENPLENCCDSMPSEMQILDAQNQLVAKLTHENSTCCGSLRSTHKLVACGPSGESTICDVSVLRATCLNSVIVAEPYLRSQEVWGSWHMLIVFFFFGQSLPLVDLMISWSVSGVIIFILFITVIAVLGYVADYIKHGGSCNGIKRKFLLELRSCDDNALAAMVSRCCWPECKGSPKIDFEVELLQDMDQPRMLALIAIVCRFANLIFEGGA